MGRTSPLNSSLRRVTLTLAVIAATALPRIGWALSKERGTTQYVHDVWRLQEGLPQNTVTAILQTRDGYFWLGTQVGLARFDGLGFKVFDRSSTPQLRNNWVTALVEGTDGTLWVGTKGGLVSLRRGVFQAFGADEGLRGQVITALARTADGGQWSAVGGRLPSKGATSPIFGEVPVPPGSTDCEEGYCGIDEFGCSRSGEDRRSAW